MNRLTVSKIVSIGAVTDGDNPDAKIMLFKNRDTDSVHIKETRMDKPDIEALQKSVDDLTALVAERDTQIAELTAEPEDILKGVSDEARAEFEKRDAQIADMQKAADVQAEALAKEKDARLTAEFTKTAEGYTGVLGDADEAGPHLKNLAEAEEAYGWLIEKMDAVAAIVATSDIFKELGVNEEGDPVDQITALAKEKQEQNSDLTVEAARVLVRKERPDLKAAERSQS